jgi:hypothetical protein
MADACPALHNRAHPAPRFAHLCSPASCDYPHLCTPRSTFPPMTTGPISGTLRSGRAATAARGSVRKGRNHGKTSIHTRGEPGRRDALCLLRRTPHWFAQYQSYLVAGVLATRGHALHIEPLSRLSTARHSPPHQRRGQRAPVRDASPISLSPRPGLERRTTDQQGGQCQASSLTCPPWQVGVHGRRHDL